MEVCVDERRIGVHDRGVGRAVDERRVGEIQLGDLPCQHVGIHRPARSGQLFAPSREIDAAGRQCEPLAVGDPDDLDVEALRKQIRALLVQLPQQRAADVADPDDGERQRLSCLEERLMDDVQRPGLLRAIDHARDVALRCALRDRADVDVVAAERPEHFAGDAGPAFHAVAHHGDDRLIGLRVERRQAVLQLEPEFLVDRLHRRAGLGVDHREANRMFRRGLRDEDDVHPPRCQRAEQPLGDPWNADHGQAAQGQQREAADRGNPLRGTLRIALRAGDERAGRARIEAVLDQNRNRFGDRRRNRRGVEHFRASS